MAEAFSVMDQTQLPRLITGKTRKEISQYRYGRGQNVVHAAIINKDSPQAIRLAFEYGADLNHRDEDGRTPLHHAIDANLIEAARTLIALGARTDIPNEAGINAKSFCDFILENEPRHETCLFVTGR